MAAFFSPTTTKVIPTEKVTPYVSDLKRQYTALEAAASRHTGETPNTKGVVALSSVMGLAKTMGLVVADIQSTLKTGMFQHRANMANDAAAATTPDPTHTRAGMGAGRSD